MEYRNLTPTQLVNQWKAIVNQNLIPGRDAKLLKNTLEEMNSVQVLLGMYKMKSKSYNISIPQFLKQSNEWLELDEKVAEIELARFVSGHTPDSWFVYEELKTEYGSWAFQKSLEAKQELVQWAERMLL